MAYTLPRIIAHRGASGKAPENTVAAFSSALDAGAEWIELDVNISADGIPYVHHDDTLGRCTNGSGYLIAQPSSELDKLDAGAWFSPEFAGEPLPTLETTIDFCIENSMALNLEIKPSAGWEEPTTEAICSLIASRWPVDLPLILSSFSERALRKANDILPDADKGLIVCAIPANWQELLDELNCKTLHCAGDLLDQPAASMIKESGTGLLCWTVNTTDQADLLFGWGVDSVFTDRPELLISQ